MKEEKTTRPLMKTEGKKFSILPKSTGLAIAMLVAGFSEVIFLAFVLALDVLPFKYLAAGIVLLLAIDALIVFLATSVSKHGTRRIGCLVIIFFMLITLLGGDYYIYSTNDTLNKISENRDTWEYYNVMVNAESSYQKAADIQGKAVYVTDMDSKQLKEAKERLITKADVEYYKEPNFVAVGEHLISWDVDENELDDAKDDGEKKETAAMTGSGSELADTEADSVADTDVDPMEAIILVSESQNKILQSNIKGFKKNTRTIYRIKVKKRANDNSKAVNVTEDSFNVLISGIDSWGSIDEGGLTDVNMVMTVNPTTREVMLTSIPRDSYVPLHSSGGMDKLTHSAIYGEEETKATIEDLLDIDINYTIKLNFSTVVDLIDAIGGLDIYSEFDFHSAISAHKFHKGWQHLSGRGCLYFARERKAFTDGDMQRNKHQQVVLKAALKKVTNSKVILTRYTSILNAVEDEMTTTLSNKDLKKLAKMQLGDMRSWSIERVSITGATGGAPCYSMGGQNLSCVFPSTDSLEKAKKAIHDTMYPDKNVKDDENTEATE